ncbi:MAG TPA: glycosyltransferase family 2 protein [Candidatus Bipolaricaulis anaerobius]|nr:glycosyltransferase family 2 protein [Candidatus Bipolaricaulis anaerobius]HNS24029.1 glycosyltransferase family 2 protein [Candidatus Bipolaricaulis anaerobius]
MKVPLVSVIMPTYCRNRDGFLQAAIESVLGQDYKNHELLIVDDGSVDGSKELIEGYASQDDRVKYIRLERNTGLPAWTTWLAFQRSSGEYIAWCFDDCVLLPNCLATLVGALEDNPSASMAYAQAFIERPSGTGVVIGRPLDRVDLLRGLNHIPQSASMQRRELFYAVGWVDPHLLLVRKNDWDLWLRVVERCEVVFVPEVLAHERGPTLYDSLGQSRSMFSDLVVKYRDNPRNHLLHPDILGSYDPFGLKHVANFSDDDVKRFQKLLLEHWARTLNIAEIVAWAKANGDNLLWKRVNAKNPAETERACALLTGIVEYFQTRERDLAERTATLEGLAQERLELLERINKRLRFLLPLWRLYKAVVRRGEDAGILTG